MLASSRDELVGLAFEEREYFRAAEKLKMRDARMWYFKGLTELVVQLGSPRFKRAKGYEEDHDDGRAEEDEDDNTLSLAQMEETLKPQALEKFAAITDLFRGGEYFVTYSGNDDVVWNFKVPDRASANLIDLIHPQPVSLTWDSDVAPANALSMAPLVQVIVPITVLFSDDEELTQGVDKWLEISSSDESVVRAQFFERSVVVSEPVAVAPEGQERLGGHVLRGGPVRGQPVRQGEDAVDVLGVDGVEGGLIAAPQPSSQLALLGAHTRNCPPPRCSSLIRVPEPWTLPRRAVDACGRVIACAGD